MRIDPGGSQQDQGDDPDGGAAQACQASSPGKRAAKYLERSLRSIEIAPAKHLDQPCPLVTALTWTNDSRDSHSQGVVGIATHQGIPMAAVATYVWNKQLVFEFDLLSRQGLVALHQSHAIWRPEKGIEYRGIPDASEVGTNPSMRLRKRKALAAQFEWTVLGWRRDRSDREELRRMPRELARYESQLESIVDGAVFAFVMGTDPEALLLIEAWAYSPDSETDELWTAAVDGPSTLSGAKVRIPNSDSKHRSWCPWGSRSETARSGSEPDGRGRRFRIAR